MANVRLVLTDRSVAKLLAPAAGQYIVRDEELKGFYLLVGKKSRRYMVQADLRSHNKRSVTIKVSVGDVSEISAQRARQVAKGYLSEISQGRHPKPEGARAGTFAAEILHDKVSPDTESSLEITLRSAWDRYLNGHLIRKGRSEKTIEGYRDHVERVLKQWLDIPLKELSDDPDRVARKHDRLTTECGPYIANHSMRTLRAIYNHAWTKNRKALPRDNPVDAVDWNPERRRDTGMGSPDLLPWFEELAVFENPIRREFHLFSLLSGCRPAALKVAKPEHLDLRRRVLHVPKPKGGAKRAFDIPLSRQMIVCLIRVMRFGRILHPENAKDWLFPAESKVGYLSSHREKRDRSKKGQESVQAVLSKWGNELRQTHRTLSAVAKVSEIDSKMLMNHAIHGVNGGYITREKIVEDHLRAQQQEISNVIFAPLRGMLRSDRPLGRWLGPRFVQRIVLAGCG